MLEGFKRKEIYMLKDKLKEMMISRKESDNSELELKKIWIQKSKKQSIIKTMKMEYFNILKRNLIRQFFDKKQKEHYNIQKSKKINLKNWKRLNVTY